MWRVVSVKRKDRQTGRTHSSCGLAGGGSRGGPALADGPASRCLPRVTTERGAEASVGFRSGKLTSPSSSSESSIAIGPWLATALQEEGASRSASTTDQATKVRAPTHLVATGAEREGGAFFEPDAGASRVPKSLVVVALLENDQRKEVVSGRPDASPTRGTHLNSFSDKEGPDWPPVSCGSLVIFVQAASSPLASSCGNFQTKVVTWNGSAGRSFKSVS